MFALYKKELQSYFLSPIAYFVIYPGHRQCFIIYLYVLVPVHLLREHFLFHLPVTAADHADIFGRAEKRHGDPAALQSAECYPDRHGEVSCHCHHPADDAGRLSVLPHPHLHLRPCDLVQPHLYLHRILPVRSGLHRTGHLHLVSDGNAAAGNSPRD